MLRFRSPFVGVWHITKMELWDDDYINTEVQAFIQFAVDGRGDFQFGLVSGTMDCKFKTERGRSYVEFSWVGNDEMDAVSGRGFAVLLKNQKLKGRLYFHQGDQSEFRAVRAVR